MGAVWLRERGKGIGNEKNRGKEDTRVVRQVMACVLGVWRTVGGGEGGVCVWGG